MCAAVGCNNYDDTTGLLIFRFPTDESMYGLLQCNLTSCYCIGFSIIARPSHEQNHNRLPGTEPEALLTNTIHLALVGTLC